MTMTTKTDKHKFAHKTHQRQQANKTPPQNVSLHITSLTHDGRGVASYGVECGDKAGKKVFVSFALPDETVIAHLTKSKKHFDEADATHIIKPSPHRTTPLCPHFGVCGGCLLQHLDKNQQIHTKQSVLANHFAKAGITPDKWLDPIIGNQTAYRTQARLGVRYLPKSNRLIVGFRERASNFLTDIDVCPILDRRAGDKLGQLKALLNTLDGKKDITHLKISMGDDTPPKHLTSPKCPAPPTVAMIVRHTKPLSASDCAKLMHFGDIHHWHIYAQANAQANTDGMYRLDGRATQRLFYQLPDFGLTLQSLPTDFTQVNLSVNRQMVKLACQLLDLKAGERVLDLFCGLGNFSLAIAKCVGQTGHVIGVEGSAQMVKRATQNALDNHLTNTEFFAQDLTQDFSGAPWVGRVDALLIDPPRTGAWEVMGYLGKFCAKRIVYVSCDPATLARDSQKLIAQGYRLTCAGVMDMFCHTAHVESIALFEKI